MDQRLELEVIEVLRHIDKGENFILSGGAGSGKTYSLVHLIDELLGRNPKARIACITYTNAAVNEINDRFKHDNLDVSTIHDFLWGFIKSYQRELKAGLIALINSTDSKVKSPDGNVEDDYFDRLEDGIQYKEYTRMREGIISHEEILEIAEYMFKEYSILCDMLVDTYQFVLIDEYQDTSEKVINILLKHIQRIKKKNIIGFFGDEMQSIYDTGIGDLRPYIDEGVIKEIQKEQNRRNPQKVIDLANVIRTDDLEQKPSEDPNAPNMIDGKVKEGSILFIYSINKSVEEVKGLQALKDWDFSNSKTTKELILTHNLIASDAGFETLMRIYDKDPIYDLIKSTKEKIKKDEIDIDEEATFDQIVDQVQPKSRAGYKKDIILEDVELSKLYNRVKNMKFRVVRKMYIDKDALIDDKKQSEEDESKRGSKRDNLVKHLFKIQDQIHLYNNKRYSEFMGKSDLKIFYNSDKEKLKAAIDEISNSSEVTIKDVINKAHELGICRKDDKLDDFIRKNTYLYSRIIEVPYSEFISLYEYLEGGTSFSTQHKIKGEQYDDVFVVLDNGAWNKYNFEYLLNEQKKRTLTGSKKESFDRVRHRTIKLFYVCCTRAMERLAVYCKAPTMGMINQAEEWFGESNVINLDNL